jgi:hypothetical protein
MKARSFEQNGITVQSQSWKRKLAHSAERILSGMLMGRVHSPRFLPLLYLVICIPTVLFLIFFRQPLGSPDELSHVARAYQISKGVLLTEEAVPGLHPKGMVDQGLLDLGSQVSRRRFESLNTALPIFQSYGWMGAEKLRRFNSSVYFPAAFIPQAIGLKVAQKLNLKLVQSLQLASILNAAFCLLIVALAIHLAVEGRSIIAFIGALPMSLHQLASPSPDGILIAGSLLIASITVTAIVQAKVSRSTLLGVVILGALTAATKLPYLGIALAALGALWWIEPRSSRKNLGYVFAFIGLVSIPVLWAKISNASTVRHSLLTQVDPSAQLAFLLSHPLEIPVIAFSTLYALWRSYLAQVVGILGWLDAPLPPIAYGILGLGFAAILAMDGVPVKPLLRWIFLAGSAVSVALIFLGLYLVWTPLFSLGPIEGVQGRYFLPILPFLMFLIPKLKSFDANNIKLLIFMICGLVGGFSTMTAIINRYYS